MYSGSIVISIQIQIQIHSLTGVEREETGEEAGEEGGEEGEKKEEVKFLSSKFRKKKFELF